MKPRNISKKTVLIIIAVVAVLAVGVGAALINRKPSNVINNTSDTTSVSPTGEKVTPEIDLKTVQRNARNTLRQNEAKQLLTNIAEFTSNNSGQMPTMYMNGQLTSSSAEYSTTALLSHYKAVSFAGGQQQPITDDRVQIVSGATCGSKGAANESSSSRNYVVQYALEQADGSYSGYCHEG
jgi:flagellar basal body-associated protein FliL